MLKFLKKKLSSAEERVWNVASLALGKTLELTNQVLWWAIKDSRLKLALVWALSVWAVWASADSKVFNHNSFSPDSFKVKNIKDYPSIQNFLFKNGYYWDPESRKNIYNDLLDNGFVDLLKWRWVLNDDFKTEWKWSELQNKVIRIFLNEKINNVEPLKHIDTSLDNNKKIFSDKTSFKSESVSWEGVVDNKNVFEKVVPLEDKPVSFNVVPKADKSLEASLLETYWEDDSTFWWSINASYDFSKEKNSNDKTFIELELEKIFWEKLDKKADLIIKKWSDLQKIAAGFWFKLNNNWKNNWEVILSYWNLQDVVNYSFDTNEIWDRVINYSQDTIALDFKLNNPFSWSDFIKMLKTSLVNINVEWGSDSFEEDDVLYEFWWKSGKIQIWELELWFQPFDNSWINLSAWYEKTVIDWMFDDPEKVVKWTRFWIEWIYQPSVFSEISAWYIKTGSWNSDLSIWWEYNFDYFSAWIDYKKAKKDYIWVNFKIPFDFSWRAKTNNNIYSDSWSTEYRLWDSVINKYVNSDEIAIAEKAERVTQLQVKPVLQDSFESLTEDTVFTFSLDGFTDNFTDKNNENLKEIKITKLPVNWVLKLNWVNITPETVISIGDISSGQFEFHPDLNYNWTDSFKWNWSDWKDYSDNSAEITLNIAAVNDAPTLTIDSTLNLNEDLTKTLNYTLADLDWTASATASALNWTVTVLNWVLTYKPNTNYNWTDTITVVWTDNDWLETIKTVTVTVNSINDTPTLTIDSTLNLNEDWTKTLNYTLADLDWTASATASALNWTVTVLNW